MEISHPWHAHPLFLSDGTKYEDKCSMCRKEIDGNPFYACVDCKYYVHKSCAQLPVEILHHFHPQHPHSLCFGDYFACDSCHKRFKDELHFRCSDCDFNLDVKCVLMSDVDMEGKESIRHSTHQHPLTISSKDGDNPLNCFACKKPSSDLIYGCSPCDYFLHKSCAEMSTHVLHAMHPQHALSLVVKFGICNYCRLNDHTWKYYCSICKFFLDVSCILESAKDAKKLERLCFLCGKQHLDSDSCVDSMYFNNQSCIQLPEAIEHEFHSHKLLLLLGSKDFGCDSCHKWFHKELHYGCEECNFRMDVKCALMPSIQNEESDESICPVIPPHFKHQHPLRLISEVNDINCTACHSTKLSPIYGCIRCEYFLHQSCLELPIQIEHPLLDVNIGIECNLELRPSVGHKSNRHLLFLIESSNWDRCNADNPFCHISQESSEFKLTKSYLLRCMECDYSLHFLCGPLPCTIKHKSHLHALKLVDSIVEDDSDEYYCDICEEIRNPRLCVYYCEDCKFFAHVHCVIFEIINIFKKKPQKVEWRIVGDLRFEDTIMPLRNNLTPEYLEDLLNRLEKYDMSTLGSYFRGAKLFRRKGHQREMQEQNLSSEVNTRDIIEELSFYNNDIDLKIDERLKLFKPDTDYHIEFPEYDWRVIEVEGYKVTSNFVGLFKTLLMKYGDFGHHCEHTENVKAVLLYFLCRIVSEMRRTYIGDITGKQLFTWLYYMRGISETGFDLEFLKPFLNRIKRSYFGHRGMKFEDEILDRLDQQIVNLEQQIVNLEQTISDIKTQIEELKWHRQQHRVGKIAEESEVMRFFFTEAKQLKHKIAGEDIV